MSVTLDIRDGRFAAFNAYDVKDDLKARGWRFVGSDKSWRTNPSEQALQDLREACQRKGKPFYDRRRASGAGHTSTPVPSTPPSRFGSVPLGKRSWAGQGLAGSSSPAAARRLSYSQVTPSAGSQSTAAAGVHNRSAVNDLAGTLEVPNLQGLLRDDEWKAIVEQDLQPGELMKIIAAAGAGKSTVLMDYMKRRPHTQFLYLCFNKSQQLEKREIFQAAGLNNVQARTFHSLCFGETRDIHQGSPIGWLEVDKQKFGYNYKLMADVKETLTNFFSSRDSQLSELHIPDELAEMLERAENGTQRTNQIVRLAQETWDAMLNRDIQQVRVTHDGYVKAFQLRSGDLRSRAFRDFDIVLLDEAHDNTICQLDIFGSQPKAKILVYDPHQCIYQFRGAQGQAAMDSLEAKHCFSLTRTFRFGSPVSDLASAVIRHFKGEDFEDFHIRTLPGKVTHLIRVGMGSNVYSHVCHRKKKKLLVLSRKNDTMFMEVMKALKCPGVQSIAFVGGLAQACSGLNEIMDLHYLKQYQHEMIQHKLIKSFSTFQAFMEAMIEGRDGQMKVRGMLVEKLEKQGINIPRAIANMQAKTIENLDDADVVFSTTHKAKGLGWGHVYMTDDFIAEGQRKDGSNMPAWDYLTGEVFFLKNEEEPQEPEEQEINLAYVAITRAKEVLYMDMNTWDWISPAAASAGLHPAELDADRS